MPDVATWLAGLGLEKYGDSFSAHEIDWDALPHLTEDDLKELGLPIGPRRKAMAAIAALRHAPARPQPPELPDLTAETGERRHVTVLFADLVGYTMLSRSLDAEQIRALLDQFFACVDRIILEHGGRIDKHIGDCVMAVFGAPVAHGNDAERAVRAALAINRAMPGLSRAAGHQLQAHIGVASGQVVASGGGSATHREYTVTGDSVNLAARLTDAAGPGEILVSDRIWESLRERLEGSEAGLLDLDGFATPVRAWRLTGLSAPVHARPLVGRDLEMEQLLAVLRACRESGRGRAVYIRGEAGIGKTRLLEEFLAECRRQGFACHVGLVLDFGTGTGRDASRSLVRGMLGLEPDSSEAAARKAAEVALAAGMVAPEAAVFLNDLLGLPQPVELRAMFDAMDDATRTRGGRAAIVDVAQRATQAQPRVLAVEDVHWADAFTLANLASLAAMVADHPALLIMTSRIEEDPIDQAWRAQAGGSPLLVIDLGPLRADDAQALAAPFFANNAAIAARCVARAQGNPLFLEQLLRHAEEGADASVPGSVQSLVQARLDRLAAGEKAALQAASVLGQRFDAEALAYLLGRSDYLPDPVGAQLMIRPQADGFLFAHALIHDAIYSSLLKSRRRELHRQAAEWFTTRDPVLRAKHLDRAEDPAAAQAYLAAARTQIAEYRYELARQLVERGLELAAEPTDRCVLSCLRGNILLDLGDLPGALQAFEMALETASHDAERCRAWIGRAAVKRITDDLDGAFADLERAEAVAIALGLTVDEARLRYLRGNLHFPRGNVEGCLNEHQRSLELARAASSAEQEAAALGGLGDAEYVRGRMISAHRWLSECVGVARRHGFGRIEVANSAQIAHTMTYLRPQGEAVEQAVAAARAAARVGDLRAEINARLAACFALSMLAEFRACSAELENVQALIHRLGAWRFQQGCLLFMGNVALAEGRRDEAADVLRTALATAERTGIRFHGPSILAALALASDQPEARRAALAKMDLLIKQGCVGHNQLRSYPYAIDVALELSDWDAAERYASALEDFTRPEPLPWSEFFVARGRVLAAASRGERNGEIIGALHRLRKEGERLGFKLALPAIEEALTKNPPSLGSTQPSRP